VLENFETLSQTECRQRIADTLEQVGLDSSFAARYPEKLSGGERQRANIARGLIVRPELIICDEPVAGLDFSLRKITLDLLKRLIADFGLACVFISHDISTVSYTCGQVAVMHQGFLVEEIQLTPEGDIHAHHPYTKRLLASAPAAHPRLRDNSFRDALYLKS
jgi:peptide/nickel transport system ATP-binding protein